MMDVYDFCFLCTEDSEQVYKIFDLASGEVVFEGTMDDEGFDSLSKYAVQSFDPIQKGSNVLTINIDMEAY